MDIRTVSLAVDEGGASHDVAISAVSAQSDALTFAAGNGDAIVSPSVDCFVRQGANPVALADGTDIMLFGGNTYRLSAIKSGNKLAFITSGGAGTVYITPGV